MNKINFKMFKKIPLYYLIFIALLFSNTVLIAEDIFDLLRSNFSDLLLASN